MNPFEKKVSSILTEVKIQRSALQEILARTIDIERELESVYSSGNSKTRSIGSMSEGEGILFKAASLVRRRIPNE